MVFPAAAAGVTVTSWLAAGQVWQERTAPLVMLAGGATTPIEEDAQATVVVTTASPEEAETTK